MRFQPRHYILLAVILALGIWNLVRFNRDRHPAPPPPPASSAAAVAADSPGWQAFDHAADLKTAPEAQFTPALNALRAQTESSTGPEAADLRNCQMWLLQYRHGASTAAGKSSDWAQLASSHVQSCQSNHRDIGR